MGRGRWRSEKGGKENKAEQVEGRVDYREKIWGEPRRDVELPESADGFLRKVRL